MIYNHPIGKDYKWYISGIYCQLGDYMVPIPPIKGTRFHSIDLKLLMRFSVTLVIQNPAKALVWRRLPLGKSQTRDLCDIPGFGKLLHSMHAILGDSFNIF